MSNEDMATIEKLVGAMAGAIELIETNLTNLQSFLEYHNQGVDFWIQYANESTSDRKLREVAEYDLGTKQIGADIYSQLSAGIEILKQGVILIPTIAAIENKQS